MSGPPDQNEIIRITEEITRTVVRVINEERPVDEPSWGRRLWRWSVGNLLTVVALIGTGIFLFSLTVNCVGPWAIAREVAKDYREQDNRIDLINQHLELGNRFLGAEQLLAAQAQFERALQIESTNVKAEQGLSKASIFAPIVEGDYDPSTVQTRLDYLLDINKDDADVRAFYGDVFREQGRDEDAINQYRYGQSDDEDEGLAHAHAGAAYVYRAQAQAKAIEAYGYRRRGQQDNARAADQRARELRDKALVNYKKALKLARDHPEYSYELAGTIVDTRDYDEALKRYIDLRDRDPEYLLVYRGLVDLYERLGQLKNARYPQERLADLLKRKRVVDFERNRVAWKYTVLRGPVSLNSINEKLAVTYFSLALTNYLLRAKAKAEKSASDAEKIPLLNEDKWKVRQIVASEKNRIVRENRRYKLRGDRFIKEILGAYGDESKLVRDASKSAGCAPGYRPCLPVRGGLNCGQIVDRLKPVRVIGSDRYDLDRDRDGLGCKPSGWDVGSGPGAGALSRWGVVLRRPLKKEAKTVSVGNTVYVGGWSPKSAKGQRFELCAVRPRGRCVRPVGRLNGKDQILSTWKVRRGDTFRGFLRLRLQVKGRVRAVDFANVR